MAESILMMVGYCMTLVAGAASSRLPKLQKVIAVTVIGIGGFAFCTQYGNSYEWIIWTIWLIGFSSVMLIGKLHTKKLGQYPIDAHFTIYKSASGKVKLHTFKTLYNNKVYPSQHPWQKKRHAR